MKVSAVFLVLTAFFLSTEAIINGVDWVNAPYIARIQYMNNQGQGGQGGGSIISHHHVLTSGFVISPQFNNLAVFLGSTTRQAQRQVNVVDRFVHPNFQASPRLNDIGIIQLQGNLNFDRFVQPIALPTRTLPLDNEQGTALGFGGWPGNLHANTLAAAFMRVVPADRCTQRHPTHVVANQFCAEDQRLRSDFCAEDVSNPFITLDRGLEVVTGIASVQICHPLPQSASEPSMFTRVSAYREWIRETIHV